MSKKKTKNLQETSVSAPQSSIAFPILHGSAAALFVATVLFSGESLVRFGTGHLLTVLWFLLAVSCAGWNYFAKNRSRFNDIAVVLFFLGITVSVLVHLVPGQGCMRYGLNSLFLWLELAAIYYVFRTILPGSKIRNTFLAIFIAIAVSQSLLGFYQYAVEMPQMVREYEADKESFLAAIGITPGSAEQTLFENRIHSPEPMGTYPLTNTLAGLLAPAFVLLTGLLIFGRKKIDGPLILFDGILAFCIGLCLLLTESRTAYIATLCGITLIAGKIVWGQGWERFRFLFSRKILGPILLVATLFVATIGIAIFSGGLNIDLLSGAKKSLGYRIEYWESTCKMIQDHPIFGCGPGNYQHVYTQYKLPNASEEIADPHNFLMEIASNSGVFVLVFFLIFVLQIFRTNDRSVILSECDSSSLSPPHPNPLPRSTGGEGNCGQEIFVPFIGSLLGFIVAFLCTQTAEVVLDFKKILLLGGSFVVAFFPLCVLASKPNAISGFLVKTTIFVQLVNLLAAGGISYPNIAAPFWLLAAFLLPSETVKRKNLCVVSGLVFMVFAIACYHGTFIPSLKSSSYFNQARNAATTNAQIALLQKAVQMDPYSVESRLALTQSRLALYDVTGSEQALQEAIREQEQLLQLAPFSASIRKLLGEIQMQIYDRRGNRTLLMLATERLEEAVKLYPNHAKTHAPLAVALEKSGENERAKSEAKIAIELDDTMPHLDQKLNESLREELLKIL